MMVNGDLSISHASGVDYEANLACKDGSKYKLTWEKSAAQAAV